MKRFLCVILSVLLTAVILVACSEDKTDDETATATADSAATVAVDNTPETETAVDGKNSLLSVPTFSIDTPYCEIKYPTMWEDNVSFRQLTDDGYTLCFYSKAGDNNVRIFDLSFNTGQGSQLGTISNEARDTLWLTSYDLDSSEYTENQLQIFSEMRDDINIILANLENDYGFIRK